MTKSHFTFDFFAERPAFSAVKPDCHFFCVGGESLSGSGFGCGARMESRLGRRVGWKSNTRLPYYIQVSLAQATLSASSFRTTLPAKSANHLMEGKQLIISPFPNINSPLRRTVIQ